MLIVVLVLPLAVYAQEGEVEPKQSDPVTVTEGHVESVNSGDVAAAEETVAEDATVTVPAATVTDAAAPAEGEGEDEGEDEDPAAVVAADPAAEQQYTGTAETQAYLEGQTAANANTTLGECSVAGETVTCAASYTSDALRARGIDFLEGQLVVTVVEGKIQSYDFTPSPESVTKIQSAFAAAGAEGSVVNLNLPTTGGEVPDSSQNTILFVALGTLLLVLGAGMGHYRFGQVR
jgi:hypothetical protein